MPDRLWAMEPSGVDPSAWPERLAADAPALRRVVSLIDAADYYRAFYESARAARRFVLMSGGGSSISVACRFVRGGGDAPPAPRCGSLHFLNGLCGVGPRPARLPPRLGLPVDCSPLDGSGCSRC